MILELAPIQHGSNGWTPTSPLNFSLSEAFVSRLMYSGCLFSFDPTVEMKALFQLFFCFVLKVKAANDYDYGYDYGYGSGDYYYSSYSSGDDIGGYIVLFFFFLFLAAMVALCCFIVYKEGLSMCRVILKLAHKFLIQEIDKNLKIVGKVCGCGDDENTVRHGNSTFHGLPKSSSPPPPQQKSPAIGVPHHVYTPQPPKPQTPPPPKRFSFEIPKF